MHHYAILNYQIAPHPVGFDVFFNSGPLSKRFVLYTLQVLAIVYTHMHSFEFANGAYCINLKVRGSRDVNY